MSATTAPGDRNGPAGVPPRAKPQDPCKLVSKAEAQAILGAAIENPRTQPLGPTCVYRTPDSSTFITVAFETLDFSQVKSQIQNLVAIDGLGHQAYCGNYGRPAIFVVLSNSKVLNVTAPCGIARQFAAKALPRVQT
jgi:hypothetical protein